MRLVTLLFLLLLTLPARARLGETEDQSIARYGQPISVKDVDGENDYRTLEFRKNGYFIMAYFLNGKCALLGLNKDDKSEFSDNEIQALLDDNSEGHAWAKNDTNSTNREWDRDDGALAQYYIFKDSLFICTKNYIIAENIRKKAVEDKKLQGF